MRFFTFLTVACVIVFSVNSTSTEKTNLDGALDPCKDTLEKGINLHKEAENTLYGKDLNSVKNFELVNNQADSLIKHLQLTGKYCCKSSGVDTSSKESEEINAAIQTRFTNYFQIIYHIEQENVHFKQNLETKKVIESLLNDCAKNFKSDPRDGVVSYTQIPLSHGA